MIVTRSFKDQSWTDISSPTKNELDSLILNRNIDPIVAKDLLTPTPRQYAKEFSGGIYAVIHIPFFRHATSGNLEQEIDFIITTNELFTTRYDSIDSLHHFAKQIEVNEILKKSADSHLFFGLMKVVYSFLFDEVEYLKDWLRETEMKIFNGHEKAMVFTISATARDILNFKRIIQPHRAVLETIGNIGKNTFDQNFNKEVAFLIEEWERLNTELSSISDIMNELRETNNSILSTKQNDIMKQLTVIGSIVLPISIVGQIFGLSIIYFPLKNNPYAFWIILGMMIFTMFCSLVYARFRRWL